MEAVLRGNFSQGNQKGVKGKTTQEAMDHILVVLKESGWGKPSKPELVDLSSPWHSKFGSIQRKTCQQNTRRRSPPWSTRTTWTTPKRPYTAPKQSSSLEHSSLPCAQVNTCSQAAHPTTKLALSLSKTSASSRTKQNACTLTINSTSPTQS
eukprot:14854573-Ditylum_brightwellii.AAC.1